MEEYTKQVLRVVVAQICQAIGWHTIQSTPLELLTDILHKYTQELTVRSFRYTQLYSRTEANLDDVGLAFRDLSINIPDLLEYINNVDSVPCAVEVPHYPVRKESSLNLLKPGSKEVITRPVHIHEYLPPIFPEKEDDSQTSAEPTTPIPNPMTATTDPSTVITDITNTTANSTNIANNKIVFKKPDATELAQPLKKSRVLHEDEGRPTREISSVMMTSSGFISPAREGKLPDSKAPVIPEYKPPRPATPPPPVAPDVTEPVTPLCPVTASTTVLSSDLKPEKRQKRQKNVNVGLTNSEAKEQRKLERHIAKMKRRRGELLPDVEKTSSPNKKTRAKEAKAKHPPAHPISGSPTKSPLATLTPSSVTHLDALPPVSLPADLTIKSETVPVCSPYSMNLNVSVMSSTTLSAVEVKPSVMDGDAVKLKSEPDKQKYNIFKKISSKKSRDDSQKGSINVNNALHHNIYSGFPPLPESTTIRPIPLERSSSPPHTDPNVIVVDDDTPPRSSSPLGLPGTQILPIPPLLPCTTVTSSPGLLAPFLDKTLLKLSPASAKKQPRKPRSKKQQQQLLVEQSAPLNLSNEVATQPTISSPKTPRKRQTKVGRPSKRSILTATSGVNDIPPNPVFPRFPARPLPCSDSLKRDDMSALNMFKDNQFLSGVQRYPIINPFHLLAGPGLIPNNSFMHPFTFPNPFSYNDFMGLRPPMRPAKIEEPSTPPPLPLPPDLESSVYCNVPPLVPDSLKHQLSPGLISKGNKTSTSSTFGTDQLATGGPFGSLKTANSKSEVSKFIAKVFDAPIEISDDEKSVSRSDTEQDRATLQDFPLSGRNTVEGSANVSSTDNAPSAHHQHHYSPSKSVTATSQRSDTESVKLAGANDESDNMVIDSDHGDAGTAENISSLNEDVPNSLLGKGEKKRDKEHKKGKRGKDGKIKKKKDKKDKSKNKEKAERRKEDKKEKDRSKKKKEKRKDKLRAIPASLIYNDVSDDSPAMGVVTTKGSILSSGTTENQAPQQQQQQNDQQAPVLFLGGASSVVPKLTLKFGSPRSIASDDSPEIRKLNSKAINGGDESTDNLCADDRRESSPELARISPLVTRPPKQKTSSREKSSDGEQTASTVAAGSSTLSATGTSTISGGTVVATRGPGRPPKNQNTAAAAAAPAAAALQTLLTAGIAPTASGTPAAATSAGGSESSTIAGNSDTKTSANSPSNGSISGPTVNSSNSGNNISLRSSTKGTNASSNNPVGSAGSKGIAAESIDAEGNQVWICPACGRVDDGTPMIGCDGCDAWYHWVCVGIQVPPDEREDWYCRVCIAKKQEANGSDKKKKRKKKNKTN